MTSMHANRVTAVYRRPDALLVVPSFILPLKLAMSQDKTSLLESECKSHVTVTKLKLTYLHFTVEKFCDEKSIISCAERCEADMRV